MAAKTLSDGAIRQLTSLQRDLLIDHIDGEVLLSMANRHLVQVRNALMRNGLLRGSSPHTIRPRGTVLTERGRAAVGMILGDCADALVRAGLLAQENPLQVLRRLKEARQAGTFPIRPERARTGLKRG
jgi:hypothetical protein